MTSMTRLTFCCKSIFFCPFQGFFEKRNREILPFFFFLRICADPTGKPGSYQADADGSCAHRVTCVWASTATSAASLHMCVKVKTPSLSHIPVETRPVWTFPRRASAPDAAFASVVRLESVTFFVQRHTSELKRCETGEDPTHTQFQHV